MSETEYEKFVFAVEADGWDLDNPAEAVTVAAYMVGPNIKRIASFLGRPRWWVAEPARLLRDNGIWRAGRIAIEGDEPDAVDMAIQACVAGGLMEVAS